MGSENADGGESQVEADGSAALAATGLSLDTIQEAVQRQPLFEEKSWRLSPQPYLLSERDLAQIQNLGEACLHFFKALELLYNKSKEDRKLLRNRDLRAPWVAEYLDRGKPDWLIQHARHTAIRDRLPFVIRPDVLPTESGFAISELDAIPGGIGLTAFLNRLYEPSGYAIVGGGDRMIETFYERLAALAPGKHLPFIAILISDEAATYRPEMEWLASELQKQGRRVFVYDPEEVMPLGDALCIDSGGNPQQIDVIYRFFELFDTENISTIRHIVRAVEQEEVAITPPIRHFQEEKLNLALFHHHILDPFWREAAPKGAVKALDGSIPRSWVMDPVELPPNAVLDAPPVGGKPITRWEQLADASQKERNLIIKISGFHETAWGARSVTLGSDSSREEWTAAVEQAVAMASSHLHILQEYRKPKRLRHPVYNASGEVYEMEGRMRLCPYFFVDTERDRAVLCGILATFCPADKKIIHGMKDAALIPCAIERS